MNVKHTNEQPTKCSPISVTLLSWRFVYAFWGSIRMSGNRDSENWTAFHTLSHLTLPCSLAFGHEQGCTQSNSWQAFSRSGKRDPSFVNIKSARPQDPRSDLEALKSFHAGWTKSQWSSPRIVMNKEERRTSRKALEHWDQDELMRLRHTSHKISLITDER